LASDPIIDDAFVLGEGRPYITALISIDNKHTAKVLDDCGVDQDSLEAKVLIDKYVQKAVNKTNHLVSKAEQIKNYVILEEGFLRDDELISGSQKLRREKVCAKYQDLINDELY
jgi:long-chain acyl-CoA synthetase